MPKDAFRREREKKWGTRDQAKRGQFLSLQFRRCPSCKQVTVQVKEIESKIVVSCKNCFLRYDFTKFPAFEEIDYYSKMLDSFRDEAREGKISPVAIASPDKIVGTCPLCKNGSLAIVGSYGSRNRFVKCSNAQCKSTFSLPYKGFFEPAREACQLCGWPLIYWEFRSASGSFALFCFNPRCKFRGKWVSTRAEI